MVVDKDKLYRMIKLARFQTKNEGKALRINNSYAQDHVAYALLRNFLLTTLAFFLLLVIIVMFNMDFWLSNLNSLNLQPLIAGLLIGYLVMLGIFSVISYTLARLRYARAENGVRQYARALEKLRRIYKEEAALKRRSDSEQDEEE